MIWHPVEPDDQPSISTIRLGQFHTHLCLHTVPSAVYLLLAWQIHGNHPLLGQRQSDSSAALHLPDLEDQSSGEEKNNLSNISKRTGQQFG